MLKPLIDFFRPPEFNSFPSTQKAKFLHYTLIISTVACLLLGYANLGGHAHLDIFIFGLGVASFLCIPLNQRGHYTLAALFMTCLVLAVMTFTLVTGVGLKDAGMLVYPIFIIYSSFLFGKRTAPLITLLAIASILLVYFLDEKGYLSPAHYSDQNQVIVILILLIATGSILWALMDNWERVMRNLTDAYDLTLSGWSKALEYHDEETEGHSQRVVELTLLLAQRLGATPQELDHIRRGALLHDIGKMAVPESILKKPGGLTDEEWNVIRQHPQHARELLEGIPFLKPALDIPYRHHERWNGSGYPGGLQGKDIPFSARVFAVVDVWDALNSDRPYRPAWTEEQSLSYLKEQAGVLFDPGIVETFLEIVHPAT